MFISSYDVQKYLPGFPILVLLLALMISTHCDMNFQFP